MATIHQQVYNSVDFANVETSEYIALSVENLFKAYDSNIKLNLDIQSCNLHMDKAIPMGLVLNELGLNAITHAFNGSKGNFYVKFTYEDGIYALDVWDDGVGLPESVDIHKSTTLWFTVIKSIMNQLDGEWSVLDLPKGFGISMKVRDKI